MVRCMRGTGRHRSWAMRRAAGGGAATTCHAGVSGKVWSAYRRHQPKPCPQPANNQPARERNHQKQDAHTRCVPDRALGQFLGPDVIISVEHIAHTGLEYDVICGFLFQDIHCIIEGQNTNHLGFGVDDRQQGHIAQLQSARGGFLFQVMLGCQRKSSPPAPENACPMTFPPEQQSPIKCGTC